MTDATETSANNPEEPHPPGKKRSRIKGFISGVRDFGNEIVDIKVKWLVAGMFIFLFSVVLTQAQFNKVNTRDRDQLADDLTTQQYTNDLARYNQDRVVFTSCLEAVARSEGNREWKLWLLDKLEDTFPDSEEASSIVTEGRAKLDELLPSLSVLDCKDPGPPPVAPIIDGKPAVSTDSTVSTQPEGES